MRTNDLEPIPSLWDELSDFAANQSAAALDHLIDSLCRMTGVSNITWAGAVRLTSGERARSDDVMRRWRVAAVRSKLPPYSSAAPDL